MFPLREIQQKFSAAIFDMQTDSISRHIAAGRLTSAERLAIYHGSIYGNFRAALGDVYPVIKRLIGEVCFDSLAVCYIGETPSGSGDIHRFGADFSQFLRNFPATEDLIYLPDVASLEWQIHELYYATELPSLGITALAMLPEDMHGNLIFMLNPACRLFTSSYPIDRIWQANQPEVIEPDEINLDVGGVHLLLRRREGVLELQLLSPAAYKLLEQFQDGVRFADALQTALILQPEFDVVSFLLHQIQLGTVVDFRSI